MTPPLPPVNDAIMRHATKKPNVYNDIKRIVSALRGGLVHLKQHIDVD